MPRVRIGAQVIMTLRKENEILDYMGLHDENGDPLEGVRMIGVAKTRNAQRWGIFLEAAHKMTMIRTGRTDLSIKPDDLPVPRYFCVVNKEIQVIDGLLLPAGRTVAGYHTRLEDAEAELQAVLEPETVAAEIQRENALTAAAAALAANPSPIETTDGKFSHLLLHFVVICLSNDTKLLTVIVAVATTTTPARPVQPAEPVSPDTNATATSLATLPSPAPPTLRRTPRRTTHTRPTTTTDDNTDINQDHEANGSDPQDVGSDAIMTDDGEEQESDHEDELLAWKRPQSYARESARDPVVKTLDELVWTAIDNSVEIYNVILYFK